MSFRRRDIDPHGNFLPQLQLELFPPVFPRDQVQALLAATGAVTLRQRQLHREVVFWRLLGLNLFAHSPLEHVLEKLCHGLRLRWPLETERRTLLPGKSARSYRLPRAVGEGMGDR